jgi:sucrose-6-phosphate hydrolase SacC (GH32 family)
MFRSLLVVLAAAVATTVGVPAAAVAPATPTETTQWRPTYHYTPAANFMNDPNGLIQYKGVYHLFYQHNPSGNTAGNGSWGHATSTDLVHWSEHPIAIAADADEEVWSGSVVLDKANTSGFGTVTTLRWSRSTPVVTTTPGSSVRRLPSAATPARRGPSTPGTPCWTSARTTSVTPRSSGTRRPAAG